MANLNQIQVTNQSSIKRKQQTLPRGYSLMDWIRFTRETPNLAGNQGILRRITVDELANHSTLDDCWIAIYDKVYNVTPYIKFHPGGVDELMKGAGINATNLFNEVHPWVNLQSMLEKCLVGNLIGNTTITNTTSESPKGDRVSLLKTDSSLKLPGPGPVLKIGSNDTASSLSLNSNTITREIPVLDSYQTIETVNIVLYTKCKNLKQDCLTIDKLENSNILLFLYIQNDIYKYVLDLPAATKDDYNFKISSEGKVELILYKIEKIHWWQMCPKLTFTAEIIKDHCHDAHESAINFRKCKFTKRLRLTHDTHMYYFDLPKSSFMSIPLGYHVHVRPYDQTMSISKAYTVVDETLLTTTTERTTTKQIILMIKTYRDGYLTPQLEKLNMGEFVEISNYQMGPANLFANLEKCAELIMICAGSGFTPMVRLIGESMRMANIVKMKMLFFNKTKSDIICKEQLDNLTSKIKFDITHILSQPDSEWNGKKGRITFELLKETIDKDLKNPLFCICGPRQFTELSQELLKSLGYASESILLFLG